MKVTKFNTVSASNIPRVHALVNPFTGEVIRDDKGDTLDFKLYGVKSDVARKAIHARDAKYGKQQKLTDEDAAQSGAEYLAAVTASFSSNIELDDDEGPLAVNDENTKRIYMSEDWIARQVHDFHMSISNYDPERWGKSVRGSSNSDGSTQSPKAKKSRAA
jgi:hypothetical protein